MVEAWNLILWTTGIIWILSVGVVVSSSILPVEEELQSDSSQRPFNLLDAFGHGHLPFDLDKIETDLGKVTEAFKNESVDRCANKNVKIEGRELEMEFHQCLSGIHRKVGDIARNVLNRMGDQHGREEMKIISQSHHFHMPFGEEQREFVLSIFQPLCGLRDTVAISCFKKDFVALRKVWDFCTGPGDKLAHQYFEHLNRDICKHNDGWLIRFFEAEGSQCLVDSYEHARKEKSNCLNRYSKVSKRLKRGPLEWDTKEEFCTYFDDAHHCLSQVFTETCQNKTPGNILNLVFNETRSWFHENCKGVISGATQTIAKSYADILAFIILSGAFVMRLLNY